MPSYKDFKGVEQLTGFEKMIGEALAKSELGGVSDGYQLDHAGKSKSGYTFGGNQMDLGSGEQSYRDTLADIIHNAKDNNGEPIILNPDEFLTAIYNDLTSVANPHALSLEDRDIINQALSSDYGRGAIDDAFVQDITQRVAYIDKIIDSLPEGDTKEALKNSDDMRLYLNDFNNQVGISPDKETVMFLSGDPVEVNGQIFQIRDTLTPEQLLNYIENQKEFVHSPQEFEYRYLDADQITLADHHFEQLLEQNTHIPGIDQEFQAQTPHADSHLNFQGDILQNELPASIDLTDPLNNHFVSPHSALENHLVEYAVIESETPLGYVTQVTEPVAAEQGQPLETEINPVITDPDAEYARAFWEGASSSPGIPNNDNHNILPGTLDTVLSQTDIGPLDADAQYARDFWGNVSSPSDAHSSVDTQWNQGTLADEINNVTSLIPEQPFFFTAEQQYAQDFWGNTQSNESGTITSENGIQPLYPDSNSVLEQNTPFSYQGNEQVAPQMETGDPYSSNQYVDNTGYHPDNLPVETPYNVQETSYNDNSLPPATQETHPGGWVETLFGSNPPVQENISWADTVGGSGHSAANDSWASHVPDDSSSQNISAGGDL